MNEPTPARILDLGYGFATSKTLLSAVELGVFAALVDGPADLPTLQERLGLHPRSARDFLDTLVALEMLQRENGRYSNSVDAEQFLDPAKPTYVGGLLKMFNSRSYGFWGSLTTALKTGKPQNEDKSGEDFFGKIYSDPDRLRVFLEGMSGLSAGAAHAIAAKFPWRDYKRFVDVGAAQGLLPVTIAHAHPHLTGIGFDLPVVKPIFEEFVAKNGLTDRIRFEPGNFFVEALPKAEVVVMGHILHDWDVGQRVALLAKAYEALPSGGAVLVYDSILDDDRRQNVRGLLTSLIMLIETQGGSEYTGADCQAWMREVGFAKTEVTHLIGPKSMAVGIK